MCLKSTNLNYSICCNGSTLLGENNEEGTEMMTIFNLQNEQILFTHYCGTLKRPVSELKENNKSLITFITNQYKSILNQNKNFYRLLGN